MKWLVGRHFALVAIAAVGAAASVIAVVTSILGRYWPLTVFDVFLVNANSFFVWRNIHYAIRAHRRGHNLADAAQRIQAAGNSFAAAQATLAGASARAAAGIQTSLATIREAAYTRLKVEEVEDYGVGFRVWVDEGGHLASLIQPYVWTPGWNHVMTCRFHTPGYTSNPYATSPEMCVCGFHVFHSPGTEGEICHLVFGVCRLKGWCYDHDKEDVSRAEYAQIMAVTPCVQHGVDCPKREAIAKFYAVPVIPHDRIEQYAYEYGIKLGSQS